MLFDNVKTGSGKYPSYRFRESESIKKIIDFIFFFSADLTFAMEALVYFWSNDKIN